MLAQLGVVHCVGWVRLDVVPTRATNVAFEVALVDEDSGVCDPFWHTVKTEFGEVARVVIHQQAGRGNPASVQPLEDGSWRLVHWHHVKPNA
jgi:hypothetical protein